MRNRWRRSFTNTSVIEEATGVRWLRERDIEDCLLGIYLQPHRHLVGTVGWRLLDRRNATWEGGRLIVDYRRALRSGYSKTKLRGLARLVTRVGSRYLIEQLGAAAIVARVKGGNALACQNLRAAGFRPANDDAHWPSAPGEEYRVFVLRPADLRGTMGAREDIGPKGGESPEILQRTHGGRV